MEIDSKLSNDIWFEVLNNNEHKFAHLAMTSYISKDTDETIDMARQMTGKEVKEKSQYDGIIIERNITTEQILPYLVSPNTKICDDYKSFNKTITKMENFYKIKKSNSRTWDMCSDPAVVIFKGKFTRRYIKIKISSNIRDYMAIRSKSRFDTKYLTIFNLAKKMLAPMHANPDYGLIIGNGNNTPDIQVPNFDMEKRQDIGRCSCYPNLPITCIEIDFSTEITILNVSLLNTIQFDALYELIDKSLTDFTETYIPKGMNGELIECADSWKSIYKKE